MLYLFLVLENRYSNVLIHYFYYQRNGMGLSTGVDIDGLVGAGEFICRILNKRTESKVARAILSKR
jgi:hydroxymethylglutaryl-CoA lyase